MLITGSIMLHKALIPEMLHEHVTRIMDMRYAGGHIHLIMFNNSYGVNMKHYDNVKKKK